MSVLIVDPATGVRDPRRRRRLRTLVVCGVLAVVVAVSCCAVAALIRSGLAVPYEPGRADGVLSVPESLDSDSPAIAHLEPALRVAAQEATDAAAAAGIAMEISSGWRSPRYQDRLLQDAIHTYGSEEVARQYVATPETSRHVRGEAIDIGSIDAQVWLGQYGAEWGLCRIYLNEPWHFELATEPGGTCPELLEDAAG